MGNVRSYNFSMNENTNNQTIEQALAATRIDGNEWVSLAYARRVLRDIEGKPLSLATLFYLGDKIGKDGLPILDIVPLWVTRKKAYRYYLRRDQVERLQKDLQVARAYVNKHGPESIVQIESRIFGSSYRQPRSKLRDFSWTADHPADEEYFDTTLPEIIKESQFASLRRLALRP